MAREVLVHVVQVVASAGWGGLEKAVVELSNELSGSCTVTALVPADAVYLDRFAPAVRTEPLPSGSRRNPLTIWRLARTIRALRPDVVHTHAAKATELVRWAGRLEPLRQVATKHNARRRRVFDRVRHATAVSAAAAGTFSAPTRVTVVPNGVRTVPVSTRVTPETFTIVAVGRLDAYKGFDRLVRAAAQLTFPFRVRIAGEGPERLRLEGLIGGLGLRERVELLGHREDVPELLSGAHVQVVPSRTEGFGLALVEGVHYAPVVLATPVGIAPEILPEEFLVEPEAIADAITRVHDGYEAAVESFAAVRAAVADRYTWARAAEAYRALYSEVGSGR